MRYVLGIDQGGSKTHAVIADQEGNLLGMGKSYGACHSSTSLEYAVQAIIQAADQAISVCGLLKEDVTAVLGGLTGIDWDYEAELLENEIQKHFPKAHVKIVNDCIIAMRAATRKQQCGILCAGSGLNCAVQNGENCFVYGFYIPDEYQGGWSLGRRAIQAVFDAHMGLLERTELTPRLLRHFRVRTVDELLYMQVTGKIKSSDYLSLPIILEEAAQKGDKTAGDIWIHYGKKIVAYLEARMNKMGILGCDVDIVLSGSIFKCKFQGFQEAVKEEILKRIPGANVIAAEYEPVIGAVLMGINGMNGVLTENIYRNIEKGADRFPVRRLENI
ncbi:N-acetylglucosamine kinase [Blautia producta]|uniref:N-acetylglucosamine kinase n=1 Tax=Blautia producta TaxID=33035 RepID=UPI0031B5DBE7